MDKVKKKIWTKPVLKKIEPTPELLNRFAMLAEDAADPPVRWMK